MAVWYVAPDQNRPIGQYGAASGRAYFFAHNKEYAVDSRDTETLGNMFGTKFRIDGIGFTRVISSKLGTVAGQVMIYELKQNEATKVLQEDLDAVIAFMRS